MSLKDVKPGSYKAKAVGGGWGKIGEKQTPFVGVNFEFQPEPGRKEQINALLYLTNTELKNGQTVSQKTFETLAKLGYNEDKPLTQDSQGNPVFTKDHLADKEMEIVIEIEPDQSTPPKMYHRVKWINEIGGSQVAGLPVQQVLGNLNLKAEMAAARARLGAPKPSSVTQSAPAQQQKFATESDIPF